MVQNARCPTDITFPLNWLLTLKACVRCIFPQWVHQMSFESFYERVFHYVCSGLTQRRRLKDTSPSGRSWSFLYKCFLTRHKVACSVFGVMLYHWPGRTFGWELNGYPRGWNFKHDGASLWGSECVSRHMKHWKVWTDIVPTQSALESPSFTDRQGEDW